MINAKFTHIIVLLALAYVFLMLGNGIVSLTNPDEVFYVQTAREMAQHNTWMTPYLFDAPQFEKPIFLYWLLRSSIGTFGNTSFAARFPAALIAILGIIAVYLLSLLGFKDNKKAFLAALIMLSCGFYIGLARSVFTDMIFSVFILFALLSFYWGYSCPSRKFPGIVLFFASCALAVLSKGPLGILIPLLAVGIFLFIKKDLKFLLNRYALTGLLVFCAIALPWYILMEIKYGAVFNREFFYNDHFVRLIKAEHISNDTWYFYPLTMIGSMFPWSLYTLLGLGYILKNLKKQGLAFNIFLVIWVLTVLLIFQFAHSKLTSYIFPLFPALAIISADYIYSRALSVQNPSRLFIIASMIMAGLMLLFPIGALSAMPAYVKYISSTTPVYLLSAALFILGITALVLVWHRRLFGFILALASFLLAVLFGAAYVHQDVEPYVSSKIAAEYLMKNYDPSGPLLCSKFYARGVRFYTGKEIAAVDIPGTPYFSPHPIPFLNTHAKVREFLKKQPVTYGILKRGNVDDFKRLTEGHFKFEVLKQIGNEYIVRVSPLS